MIMDLTRVKETAKELLNKFAGALKELPAHRRKVFAYLTGKINFFEEKYLGRFPKEKRRFILLSFAGLFVILIALALLMVNSGKPKEGSSPPMSAGFAIPDDELFIPGEPDFVPDFLPERESRLSWSLEEIRPYWRSPENAGLWRGEVKSAVDNLMEGVP
jgi:hypothetical protein